MRMEAERAEKEQKKTVSSLQMMQRAKFKSGQKVKVAKFEDQKLKILEQLGQQVSEDDLRDDF